MPRLVEGLSRFFGRVEILALGLENERRAAEAALARGMPLEARDHAREIVASLPDSPLGLALWADAAEDAWLDHEVVGALNELAKVVPWRADVWLRLGLAGGRIGWPHAREALERAAVAPDERASARLALLELADLDLAAGDGARATFWLDRIAEALSGPDAELALRRAECAIARGDLEAACEAGKGLGDESPIDGRGALVRARLALHAGDTTAALALAQRAFVLDAPGGREVLGTLVATCRDGVTLDRLRRFVSAAEGLEAPTWAAAFAFAEGRQDDARRALVRGLGQGDRSAAAALLRLATEARDLDALAALDARDPALVPPPLRALREAAALAEGGRDGEALERLDQVIGDAAPWAPDGKTGSPASWAAALRSSVVARWLSAPTDWTHLLQELQRTARAVDRLDQVSAIEALAMERERPLRVAVVGEFNAGKSTFLNALLAEDVAPTGVLPTTATLHWVAWAPDPFARVVVRGSPDRVIPHAELKATLEALRIAGARVERVFIYAPIERLKRVEVLDTPGFNAPDPDHLAAARAAFDEAHFAIWLLDATGPMKESERRVLSEIQTLGVPLQILVNKADRLKPADRERVLTHISGSLGAVGLVSQSEPILFSARLSLKGRLGDEAALAASGWAEVEALFGARIVDASEALRERALRRKAARVATLLASVASARAVEDREAIRAARQRGEAQRSAAGSLRRDRAAVVSAVDQGIEPARRLLSADLRPLGELPEERQRGDAGLRAYLEERFVARLAEPVVAEIARAAGVAIPGRAAGMVRSVLMGAVASHEAPALLLRSPLERVLGTAVEAFATALLMEAEDPLPRAPFAAIEARAEAVRKALADGDAAASAPVPAPASGAEAPALAASS